MSADGVYIPKEQNTTEINQFRPISLLNVEGKIFFSGMASRLTKHLTENRYINTSVQKEGIPGVSGCLEHATKIWEAIQRAKSEKLNLDVIFWRPGKCLRVGTTSNDSAGPEDVPCSGGYTSHAR